MKEEVKGGMVFHEVSEKCFVRQNIKSCFFSFSVFSFFIFFFFPVKSFLYKYSAIFNNFMACFLMHKKYI